MKKSNMRLIRIPVIILALIIILIFNIVAINSILDYRPPDRLNLFIIGNGISTINSKQDFSILSWNTGYAGLGKEMDFFYEGGKQVRPSRTMSGKYLNGIAEELKSAGSADFYFFQEVDVRSKRSYNRDELEQYATVLNSYTYAFAINYNVWFVPVPPLNPMGRVKSGQAIFARYFPSEAVRYAFSSRFPWPKRLFMLDRCFILERFMLDNGKDLVLINTHNSTFDNGSLRQIELAELKNTLLAEFGKGNYVVAGGDWNMNPPGYNPGMISTGDMAKSIDPPLENDFLPSGWGWAYDPSKPTNRDVDQPYEKGKTATTIIDFFVLSPNVEYLSAGTLSLGFENTDHNPVVLHFRLRD
jgi:endonuclease/exonuclease/phosphatase family metal-dependent hydrolase